MRIIYFLMICAIADLNAKSEVPEKISNMKSLKSDKVNVRVGPGEDYPIVYRYLRKGIPVQVIAEFKTWIKIRDKDGDEGWVANRLLSNKNTVIISKNTILYTKPLEKSIKLAIVEKGVIAEKVEENSGFLKIKLNTKTGWIKKDDVWGVDV